MDFPFTTGGIIQGDLILIKNPATYTEIEKGSAFNELVVNLSPVGNLITFALAYNDDGPPPGFPPDEISLFLLGTSSLPLVPTSDPTGANALFAIDLTGIPGGDISIFAPTIQNQNNLSIIIPGQNGPEVPEPAAFWLLSMGLITVFLRLAKGLPAIT
jgi:hypothetical protein